MKKSTHPIAIVTRVVAAVALACLAQTAKAGWTGSMNGLGIGWSSVNVTASNVISGTLSSNLVSSPTIHGPSASMVATVGYIAGGPLPDGASPATIAQIKGTNNYKWTAKTIGSNGDKTDNAKLDSLVKVDPSDCASLEIDSTADIAPDGKSGTLHVNTKATSGTALLLRGYEYKDPTPPNTVDELETNQNSFLKWHVLMVGPFDLNSSNCTAVNIPFSIDTSVSNLYFVVDGEAKSLPLVLYCPTNITVSCGDTVTYPPAYYSACGDVDVTYNPPENYAFPVGTTPVTITIKDHYGNATNCTFTVTFVDNTKPVVPALADVVGQCSAQVPTPTTIDVCGTITTPVVGTTTDRTNYTAQGNYVVHWSFDDGHNNISTATQNVIVKDTMLPAKPTLADLNYSACSGVVATPPTPTTTDNCAGIVTGTTTTQFPITTMGTTVVTWTFDDGNGNKTTATQNVTLKDTTPPVKPTLPNLSYSACSGGVATPPTPTTTDNCAGIVTGTTTTPFPITTPGTTVVTWTFDDGNGNKTTATQNVTFSGLTFAGFYSPIGGLGGTCSSPVQTVNKGSVVPIKFDISCGSTVVTGGTPPIIKIQPYSNNCVPGTDIINVNAVYQNNWHYNWDTSGWKQGTYNIVVVMPDGSSQFVVVKLK